MGAAKWVLFAVFSCGFAAASAPAMTTYLTDFTKNNNIYTNLNEEFPHTGTGTPGSGVGTANATFVFDPSPAAVQAAGYAPDYVAGSNLVNNGVDFELASNAAGQDFDQLNSTDAPLTVTANVSNVQTVYLLMGAYDGQSFNVTLTGANGATDALDDIFVPDFNGGGPINTTASGASVQTVFEVKNIGAGGSGNSATGVNNTYDLTEVTIPVPATLSNQQLSTITLTSEGYDTLLLGVTVSNTAAVAPPTVPLPPAAWQALIASACLLGVRLVKDRLAKRA